MMDEKAQRPERWEAWDEGCKDTYLADDADAFIEYLETELLYTRRALSIAAATSSTEWLPRDYIASARLESIEEIKRRLGE